MILGGNGVGKTTLWEVMRSEAVQVKLSTSVTKFSGGTTLKTD